VINLKNTSIWLDSINQKELKPLEHNIEVDVLVIGGGITGMSCCYHLMNSNKRVVLVEANRIGQGITSRTTGKLTYLQDGIYRKIKNSSGTLNTKLYYESQKEAISIVKNIIDENKINCDLSLNDSYLFTNDKNKISNIEEELELLKSFNETPLKTEKLDIEIPTLATIKCSDTYVFHPLKYLESLKKILLKNDVELYENTRILSIDKFKDSYLCKTSNLLIKAKEIVLALHYPYFLDPFFMPLKVYLEKSYIGASKVENTHSFNAISLDRPVKSIRYQDDSKNKYQIFLYGSRNIGTNLNDKEHFEKLKLLPFNYEYLWSNIDIITSDYLPYIGKINHNLYLATGYNTWGMTNGSLAGKIISDLILNKNNRYTKLFNPLRGIKIKKIPLILGSSMKPYTNELLFPKKSWYKENLRFAKKDGKSIAIYTDSKGKEHIVYTKCPHLKCGLVFNEVEKTWDCPCHGSRFNIDGICIEGPSNYDISYKNDQEEII